MSTTNQNTGTAEPLAVVNEFFDAIQANDFDRLRRTLADDVRWHQPGNHPLAGTFQGPDTALAMMAEFPARTAGTFRVEHFDRMCTNDMVAVTFHMTAQRPDRDPLDLRGVDVIKVTDGLIVEAWVLSNSVESENAFWS